MNILTFVLKSKSSLLYFDEISRLNIVKLILDVEGMKIPDYESIAYHLFELSNNRDGLVELEIKSKFDIYIDNFVEIYSKLLSSSNINRVIITTFTIARNSYYAKLKQIMRKYFSEIKRNHDSMICSFKIQSTKLQKLA